jgi:hypothetical protein
VKQVRQVKHRDKNLSHLKNLTVKQVIQNWAVFINFDLEVRKNCVNASVKLRFIWGNITQVKGLTISCSGDFPLVLD